MPNIFRRVLDLPELTHNYTQITNDIKHITSYYHMVRVFAWHTMQDVENAIAVAEGWLRLETFFTTYANGERYTASDNVFEQAKTDDERMLPRIWFQLEDMSQRIP